tara:strand:+ start:607 stop:1251 length:645 start_codon:yes stop_codon:yes gene_type:complete
MVYNIFGFDYTFDISFFQLCLLAALLGLFSKFLLTFVNIDYFATGNNQILVFSLLPVTGFVITSAISNNIALSLGMVGALSIVRFRTPIKNPLELVIYFYLITIGIVTNVNPNIAVNFTLFFIFVSISTEIYKAIGKRFNLNVEQNTKFQAYLRIEMADKENDLNFSEDLIHQSYNSNNYSYSLGFKNIEDIYKVLDNLEESKILNYSIDKSSD